MAFQSSQKSVGIMQSQKNFAERITMFYELFKFLFISPPNQVLVRGHHSLNKPTHPFQAPIPTLQPKLALFFFGGF